MALPRPNVTLGLGRDLDADDGLVRARSSARSSVYDKGDSQRPAKGDPAALYDLMQLLS